MYPEIPMIVIWPLPSDSLVTMAGLPNIAIHAMAVTMRTKKFAMAVSVCLVMVHTLATNEMKLSVVADGEMIRSKEEKQLPSLEFGLFACFLGVVEVGVRAHPTRLG